MNITIEKLNELLGNCEMQLCKNALVDIESYPYSITGLSILPRLHLLSIYKHRFEMQANGIVSSRIIGYPELIASLSISCEEEIITFFMSSKKGLYVLFIDTTLNNIVGILKKDDAN